MNLVELKDGWTKERGGLRQWISHQTMFSFSKERNESLYIETEAEIKDSFDASYGYPQLYMRVEYSTSLVRLRVFEGSTGAADFDRRIQILERGSLRKLFTAEDKAGPLKFVKDAKKLCDRHIKRDLAKYHREDYDHTSAWRTEYNWNDYDAEFKAALDSPAEASNR